MSSLQRGPQEQARGFFPHREDEDEWTRFYEEHYAKVYGKCRRIVHEPALAHDMAQETFLRVWKYKDTFRGDCAITSWLYAVATTTCLMYLRAQKSTRRLPRVEVEERLDEVFCAPPDSDPVLHVDLVRAISQLPEGYKRVVLLHGVHGLTHQEIGQATGRSSGNSKSQFNRATRKLRENLNAAAATAR